MERSILITSAGSWTGLSILQCLRQSSRELIIKGINTNLTDPPTALCDEVRLCPLSESDDYPSAVQEILRELKPDLVIAARDGDLAPLSKLKPWAQSEGINLTAPDARYLPIFNDKAATAVFAQEHDLPFARTASDHSQASKIASEVGFPLIAKPSSGTEGSKGVSVVRTKDELELATKMDGLIVQEFLEPAESDYSKQIEQSVGVPWMTAVSDWRTTASATIASDGAVIDITCSTGIYTANLARQLRIETAPAAEQTARRYATALSSLGFRGVANIDGKLVAGRGFVPFEMNGRFGRSCWAHALLGRHEVLRFLAQELNDPRIAELRSGFKPAAELCEYPEPLKVQAN